VRTAYRCRAYPDLAQQQVLARTFGCVRVVWNRTLAARRARYAADGTSTSYARYQNGSANRAKAAAKVVRAHSKVRHPRQDFLHRVSTRLVRENDLIVIEDLAVKNMIRNRRLARAITDCGWGEFRR
jgi:transposase